MTGNREKITPYEYEERAGKFVEAVRAKIFPQLIANGCSCDAFTLSETMAEGDEELPDDTEEDLKIRQFMQQARDKFDNKLTEEGIDRGELMITAPQDKKSDLMNLRPELHKLASSFAGEEFVWLMKEEPSPRAVLHNLNARFEVKPGQEKQIVLLASYQFKG